MAKHDRASQEKKHRNEAYAQRFRQRVCKDCGHVTSRLGRCKMCGGTKWKLRRKPR